ncbi:MAG: TIR domain-containing protein [Desulfobacteraceae bacterium]|nr:TIR domain-containing protein [Desulfobacteraceae bacterium]
MPSLNPYRLFISHAWTYGERYQRMINLLDKANNFAYINYSVPEDKKFERMNKEQLKEEIRQQIRPAQVVIIIAGMYVAHSEWIQFEINVANALNKQILGVRQRGGQRVPDAVSSSADELVNWNTDSIVQAIRRLR